ncbi:MAG: hypothetical protein LBO06_00715 [Bacteroidales bacterium]|jgi:uncharacterized protein YycO|nr:hypothetical protein [Bacteroidales bacterium]
MYKTLRAALCVAVLFCFTTHAQNDFWLQKGDLLFQANEPSQLANAIEGAGKGYNNYAFSHVGIVNIEGADTVVIEAVPKYGVRIVSLQTFLADSQKDKSGKPLVCVGRLLPQYESVIEQSVNRAAALAGKAYNNSFLPNTGAYYCSELVFECFLDANGSSVFTSSAMSFKDKETNEFYLAWVEFFSQLDMPIPEGVVGTNPNDMSNDKAIKIVYCFGK